MLLHSFKSIILLFHILCLHAVQTIDNTPELSCLRHLLHTNVMTIISIRFFCFFCCILHKMCFIWHLVQRFLPTESSRSLSWVINPSLVSPPPNPVPRCHIYTSLKPPQGWWLSCFPGQPLAELGNPLGVKSWHIAKMGSSTWSNQRKLCSLLFSLCFHHYPRSLGYLESFWGVSHKAWVPSSQPFEFLHTWLSHRGQCPAQGSGHGLQPKSSQNSRKNSLEWACPAAAARHRRESRGSTSH